MDLFESRVYMEKRKLYLLMSLHVIFSSGTYIFSKFAAVGFADPLFLTAARAVGAMVIFMSLPSSIIPKPNFTKKEWALVIFLGTLLVLGNQFFFLYGLQYTVPSHPALFYALTPIGVLLLNTFITKKRPPITKIIGILLAFVGVLLLLRPWEMSPEMQVLRFGDIWIIIAVLCWVVYTVIAGKICKKHNVKTVTAYSLSSGALVILPFGIYRAIQLPLADVSLSAWGGLAYLIIFTSVLMMLLWNYLLKKMNPEEVAVSSNMQLPTTVLMASSLAYFGFLKADQDLNSTFFTATICIVLGVFITQKRQSSIIPKNPKIHSQSL